MTRCLALPLLVALAATPASAQDDDSSLRDGFDMFSEGARIIMEGLLQEMRPMLEDAEPFLREDVAPFFANLWDMMGDITEYEMPERLPNGDIIIRRSPDAPPLPDADGDTPDSIDL